MHANLSDNSMQHNSSVDNNLPSSTHGINAHMQVFINVYYHEYTDYSYSQTTFCTHSTKFIHVALHIATHPLFQTLYLLIIINYIIQVIIFCSTIIIYRPRGSQLNVVHKRINDNYVIKINTALNIVKHFCIYT